MPPMLGARGVPLPALGFRRAPHARAAHARAEPYRGYRWFSVPRPTNLLPEWHQVYWALVDEVQARRGHPDPTAAGDEDCFEIRGPCGARFSVASSQTDYRFYAHDGSAWVEIEDLQGCITRLSDQQRGPPPYVAALANLRAARDLVRTSLMQLRDCPNDDPQMVSVQAYHEMNTISSLLVREMGANARRAHTDDDDDDDDADFAPSSSSESDTSFDSLDSGDRAVVGDAE